MLGNIDIMSNFIFGDDLQSIVHINQDLIIS